MSRFTQRLHVSLILALCTTVFTLLPAARPAAAGETPCFINGPTSSSTAEELCGPLPAESYYHYWTFPNGSHSNEPCIIAEASGTYTLIVTSIATGLKSAPCTHTFTRTTSGGGCIPCETVVKPICPGETIELCALDGGVTYRWRGPNDFTSTSQCITVGVVGTYVVTITDAQGCVSTCTTEVPRSGDCPGEGDDIGCPRTPGFWTQQCAQRDNGSRKFSRSQMDQITGCMDEASTLFDWTSDFSSFCGAIDPARPMDVRKQARRQFAAFLANLCTQRLGLGGGSTRVGLDPTAEVTCGGRTLTIAQLFTEVDAALVRLQTADLSLARVRNAYGDIITCLDAINNGRGFDTDCGDENGDAAIKAALGTDSEIALGRAYPNPFQLSTRVAFAVPQGGAAVKIGVYDLAGRLVRSLADGFTASGRHEVMWDGRDGAGMRVQPAVYFIRGVVGGARIAARVLMVP